MKMNVARTIVPHFLWSAVTIFDWLMGTIENPNVVGRFVFYAVIAIWFVFFALFVFRKSTPKSVETRRDRLAMVGILLQGIGYAIVWFRPLQRPSFSPLFSMPKTAELAMGVLTVAMAAGSVWMIYAAVQTLGKHWAVAARLVEGHKLITKGPYRLVRNPIYTGMFGMMLATGLAVTRWSVLVPAAIVFLVGTYIRVRIEERLLRGYFGSEFDEYTRRVPAVIPGIW